MSEGNTDTSSIRSRSWVFTLNNYKNSEISLIRGWSDQYCFQAEKVTTPHLQGVIRFKSQKTLGQLKQLHGGIHWEKCKDWKHAVIYCQKKESRIDGPWIKGCKRVVEVIDPLDNVDLYDWQKSLLSELKTEPDPRKIIWYCDVMGGKGKTSLCKHLVMNNNCLMVGGKASDMKYGVMSWIKKHGSVDIILINLTRSVENFVSYEGIESVKDGIFFSNKYESEMIFYNPPHLIVMANFEPNYDALIRDRWDVRMI